MTKYYVLIMVCGQNDAYKNKTTKIVSMQSTEHTGDMV